MGKLSFSGHQTFTLRYGWLPKAVEAIGDHNDLLHPDEAMLILGVGKNMVGSIIHWLQATDVAVRENGKLKLTSFGEDVFGESGVDRYLEDIGTLWLLHWNLASRPEYASTCYWLFNCLRQHDFKEKALLKGLKQWIVDQERTLPSDGTLVRDIDCYLRTYIPSVRGKDLEDWIDCPLGELNLITSLQEIDNEKWYRFASDASKTLPQWVLQFAIEDFWYRKAPARMTLAFEEIVFGEGSPGLVFKIGPDALVGRLEGLETGSGLMLTESNGIRNVVRQDGSHCPHVREFFVSGNQTPVEPLR
jgi:hypothetical protein